MSEVIIEEVDKNDLSESELAEFVQTDEIPVVDTDDEIFDSSGDDTSESENVIKPTKIAVPAKKSRSRSKKQISAAQLERSQSAFLKKFMNGEISYNDYVKRMENASLDDGSVDEEDYDSDASNVTIKKVQKRTKRQTEKAETHHAKKSKRALPAALQGLMGQANLCFARNDVALAEKLCLEIIRQEPMAAEPYLTLSQIYEHTDEEKYKQLILIAAHVNSTSVQWQQVADIFFEKGNLQQASFCLAKATRCDPKNLSIRIKRLEILKQLGDEKHVLHCTYCMLGFIPKEDHKFLISQAKWVAKKYHEDGQVTKSLDAMLKAYSKVPEHFTTEDVHSFIELLVNNKQYRKCLQVLMSHTGLQIKIIQKTKDAYEFTDLLIPDDMLIDLRTKMSICFVHLDANNLIPTLVENIKKFVDVENSGDCYLDIAEALIAKSNFNDALRLLDPLVHSKAYSLAGVWLQHADCLRASSRFLEAIDSYKKVVELSQHTEARLTLAALLKQEGRMDEALNALTEDYSETGMISTDLLKEKCILLKELDRIDDYLQNGYTFLLRHCMNYRSRQEVQIVSNFTKTNDRLHELKNLRK
jgi:general transcription factor 3C polypeptide 3 (transcription factor C subunit 4)